jgi:hypothetical protein
MQRLISRCYCNEQTDLLRLQTTGAAISPVIVNPNGLHGRADHKFCEMQVNFIASA